MSDPLDEVRRPETLARVRAAFETCYFATGDVDRPAVEAAVREAYAVAGARPPTHLLWADSPLAGVVVAILMNGRLASAFDDEDRWHDVFCEVLGFAGGFEGFPNMSSLPDGDAAHQALLEPVMDALLDELRQPTDHLDELVTDQVEETLAGERGWELLRSSPFWELAPRRLDDTEWRVMSEYHDDDYLVEEAISGWELGFGWEKFRALLGRSVYAALGPEAVAPAGPAAFAAAFTSGACWWWAGHDLAVLTVPPVELHRDDQRRLHHPDGPAVLWPDGFAVWARHGVRVPAGS